MKMLHPRLVALLMLIALVGLACDPSSTTEPKPDPVPKPPNTALRSITELKPGEFVTLTGTKLGSITSLRLGTIAIDDFELTSDSTITFQVPVMRECETDGRRVYLTATAGYNHLEIETRVRAPEPLRMDVGEVLELTPDDVGRCLQLPEGERFVLWAFNPTFDPAAPKVDAITFRTWTESNNTPELRANIQPSLSPLRTLAPAVANPTAATAEAFELTPASDPYSDNPVPFDPNYATAQVGDTVWFVDWWGKDYFDHRGLELCQLTREEAYANPAYSYPAVIAAVSGMIVIAVDLRSPNAEEHLSDFGRAWLQTGADIAAPLLIPTMREVFDPDFEPIKGGGGRMYALIAHNVGAPGVGIDGGTHMPQADCPLHSEMTTVRIGDQTVNRTPLMARDLAKILIHEYAHNAATITGHRNGWFGGGGAFWGEAVAEIAEGAALRIAMSQSMGADWSASRDGRAKPHYPFTTGGQSGRWGTGTLNMSLWENPYSPRTLIYTFAQERFGDAPLGVYGPGRKTLFQAYMPAIASLDPVDGITALADAIGMTPQKMIREAFLAHAIDDLIDPKIANRAGLPIIRTWDLDESAWYRPTNFMPRIFDTESNERFSFEIAPSDFTVAYSLAAEGRSVSIEVESMNADHPLEILLIRVR